MSHSQRKAWKEAIMEYSKELRLPMIRKHLEEYVREASQRDVCYEEFLAQLLEKECDARREASRYNRIRLAEFTHKKYLEDLSVDELPQDAQKKLKLLKTLGFIPEGRNVILAGNPGTGNYRKNLVMERFSVAP
ncbi:ATP-binding protein [Paenibacillus naphthalenovorans]|uniref:ATP-binding protein n=1 Tax=Paenibacillus naphthalenovorans TaxID=162209 RepID=UPI000880A389|nr:ATP-binding protein [Paenibacillus naphthalenovorans]SDJ44869.1 IstB-like ATP binding protein [Paenibacillus naphthalenovorans]